MIESFCSWIERSRRNFKNKWHWTERVKSL